MILVAFLVWGIYQANQIDLLGKLDALTDHETTDHETNTDDGSDEPVITKRPGLFQTIADIQRKRTPPKEFVSHTNFDTEFAAYYARLPKVEQEIYEEIYDAVANARLEVTLTNPTNDINVIGRITHAILNDHPKLFWWENKDTRIETTTSRYETTVKIKLAYNELANDLDYHKRVFDSEVETILTRAHALKSIEEQELFIHDLVAGETIYVDDSKVNQTAYSAIVNHESVCAGYARAFQHLMMQLGVPTYYVSGTGQKDENSAPEPHAWNLIKLDDQYYNVDVTWDNLEPNFFDGHPHTKAIYRYFNRTDEFFTAHQHVRASDVDPQAIPLPDCTASEAAFENLFGSDFSANSLAEEFNITEDDIITTLSEYYVTTYTRLKSARTNELQLYFILTSKELKESITNLTSEDRAKNYVDRLFKTKYSRYTRYQMNSMCLEISDGVYLIEINHKFM